MPLYHFTQYQTNYFTIEAESIDDAWERYRDGDYSVDDSDITDSDITDIEELESEKIKTKVGEATRLPLPDARRAA